jgi:hypothetical protein
MLLKDVGFAGVVLAGSIPGPKMARRQIEERIWHYGGGQPPFRVFWLPVPDDDLEADLQPIVDLVQELASPNE